MDFKEQNCPNCGAPITLKNRFVEMLVCPYCETTIVVQDDRLDPTGKTAEMTRYPTPFEIGKTGSLKGEPFEVIGRVRYEFDQGWWDEWCLNMKGEELTWIEEDEGMYRSFKRIRIKSAISPWDEVNVGSMINVNNTDIFIMEKNSAKILGAEGNLTVKRIPGTELRYVDGTGNEKQFTIEFYEKSIMLKTGEDLDRGDFSFNARED